MKRILFPTDFSEVADNAFVYALHLAKILDMEVFTLHVHSLPNLRTGNLSHTLVDFYEYANWEKFENYRDSIPHLKNIAEEAGLSDITMYHCLEEGDTIKAIQRKIKQDEIDLVVMGTTGATGVKKVFLGSVAGEVLENAPCPVIAVPRRAMFNGNINRFGITTNYSVEDEAALRWLMVWAKSFGASIEVVHADYNNAEGLSGRMQSYEAKFGENEKVEFKVIGCIRFEAGINTYLNSSDIDVLAMLTHKRNFWQELFSTSQIKKLSYYLDLPVMSLPSRMLNKI